MKFYTACIRSRIDYASHVYSSATENTLKPLEGLQNQCLRIALGTKNTTPIITMNVEANIPPLSLRRSFLTLKYYSKLFDYPNTSRIVKALASYNYRFIINKNFFERAQVMAGVWELEEAHHKPMRVYSKISPWQSINDYLSPAFGDRNTKNLSDTFCQEVYKEMVDSQYRGFMKFFTDGSKNEDCVTAGVYALEGQQKFGYKLKEKNTVVAAELYGIRQALEMVKNNNRDCVIFTDSLASILIIADRYPYSYREAAFEIQDLILNNNCNRCVKIQWVPAHRGIHGNEMADKIAKDARGNASPVAVRLSVTERQKEIRSKMDIQFKRYWDIITHAGGSGSFLKQIKIKIEYWEHANVGSRSLETVIARLRSGHVELNQYLFRFTQADSPLCACGDVETVSHFLLNCPLYVVHRNILKMSINKLSLENKELSL